VAFGRLGRTDGHSAIGHRYVKRVLVGLGIDGDRLDAHAAGGFDDPAGDLAAIGNQDTLEHAALRVTPSLNPVAMAADNRWLLQYCLAAAVSSTTRELTEGY